MTRSRHPLIPPSIRAVLAGAVAATSSGVGALACPVAPPGVATGEVFCIPADGGDPPSDQLGGDLRIANSEGSMGSLTLSAGDVVVLGPGSDPDFGLAGPFVAVGRRLGASGELTIDGAGAELRLENGGYPGTIWLGRDGGQAEATVSNGGRIVIVGDDDIGAPLTASGAGLMVGRAGAGTVGQLTLDAGTLDFDSRQGANVWVGRQDSFGQMNVRNGSLVSLRGTDNGFFSEVNVGGSGSSAGRGELSVDASRVELERFAGEAGFYVARNAGSLGTAAFSGGAELDVASVNGRAVVIIGAATGGFGSLSLTEGSTAVVDGAEALLDIAREPGSEGVVAIVAGSTMVLTADDPEAADVAVGAAFSFRPIAGEGELLVSGAGSALRVADGVFIGGLGGFSAGGRVRVGEEGVLEADEVRVGRRGVLAGSDGFVIADVTVDGGTVAPGDSAGVLTVDGDFTLAPDGRLELEVLGPGEFDVLSVSGLLDLSEGVTEFLFDAGFLGEVLEDFGLMPSLSEVFGGRDPAALAGLYPGRAPGGPVYALGFDPTGALVSAERATPVPLPPAALTLAAALAATAAMRRRREGVSRSAPRPPSARR